MGLKELLNKVYAAFADGLGGFRDAVREQVFRKDKKEGEEIHWSEKEPDKPTIKEKVKKIVTGPKRLPGSTKLKRVLSVLLLPVYFGIGIYMLGENPVVEIIFLGTIYILVDYISITHAGSIWNIPNPKKEVEK